MQAVLDDNNAIYVTDNSPLAEPRYRARFYFDPNSIVMTSGNSHYIFYGYTGASTVVMRLEFRFSQGNYQVRANVRNDASTWSNTNWFTISDTIHFIEFDWQAATAAGANNGVLTLWIDGQQQANLTGIDNDTRRIDMARLGAIAGVDSGTRGTYYFDAFESRRQTYIGPESGIQIVTTPSLPENLENLPVKIYLPVIIASGNVQESGGVAPDLIVESISVTGNTINAVIGNQGDIPIPADTPFWVDLYVNPNPAPTGVNQLWSDGRSTHGIVWGITTPALPLEPGETINLTLGDAYNWPSLSNFSGTLPAGTVLYGQVDSANTNTNYGGVLEKHEIEGTAYNNISAFVLPSAFNLTGPGLSSDPASTSAEYLPARP